MKLTPESQKHFELFSEEVELALNPTPVNPTETYEVITQAFA